MAVTNTNILTVFWDVAVNIFSLLRVFLMLVSKENKRGISSAATPEGTTSGE